MSMSSHVVGFMEPDAEFKKMYAVYTACREANVEPPDEVDEYFQYETPDELGMQVGLDLTEYKDDMQEGYELRVSEIPKGVTVIRFFNSY